MLDKLNQQQLQKSKSPVKSRLLLGDYEKESFLG